MNEHEVNRIFGRINGGCLGCTDWRGDRVRAAVGAFLVAHWDHREGQPMPRAPTPEVLAKLCCRAAGEGLVADNSITYATSDTSWER